MALHLELAAIGEQIVAGGRTQPRSVTETMVPADVALADNLLQQGGAGLGDQLRNIVPSFNVSIQPISDAAAIVRPANPRNLAPEPHPVLFNGKRRHRGAVIT